MIAIRSAWLRFDIASYTCCQLPVNAEMACVPMLCVGGHYDFLCTKPYQPAIHGSAGRVALFQAGFFFGAGGKLVGMRFVLLAIRTAVEGMEDADK